MYIKALTIVLSCMCVVVTVRADEVEDLVDSLYGERIKRVTTSTDKADDAELAAELLVAAKEAVDQPAVVSLICFKAYDLAIRHKDGHATALAAMAMVLKHAPDQASSVHDKVVLLRQRQLGAATGKERAEAGDRLLDALLASARHKISAGEYSAAMADFVRARSTARSLKSDRLDEIQDDYNAAVVRKKVLDRVLQLQAQIEADPEAPDALRQTLFTLVLVELEDLPRAQQLVKLADDATAKVVAHFETKPADLPAETALALGQWYGQAGSTTAPQGSASLSPTSRLAALGKASMYYKVYLKKHASEDDARAQAKTTLSQVTAQIEALEEKLARDPARKTSVTFIADKSMKPCAKGQRYGSFPIQQGADARGPFAGSGVYFSQPTGQEVYYLIKSRKRIRAVYYKGAATSKMKMQILDTKGRVLASAGPFNEGNVWSEHAIKVPTKAAYRFILHFHNAASTWFYIDTLVMR